MAKRFVELSQPLFNGMPRAKAHGDVKFWVDRVCVNHASGSFQVCITHLEMAAVERKISILGVDTITPDLPGPFRPQGFDFPVHTRLLGNDILVIENLGVGLKEVLGKRVTVAAVPFRIEGGDASPITPLALID